MLDILRRHASSWLIKALLGLIAIVFIFFFGSSAIRAPQESTNILAKVNGEPISVRDLEGRLNMQRDSNPAFADLPDSLLEQIRSNLVNALIQEKITVEEALKLGLRAPDEEVSKIIQENPSLLRNGKFDLIYYQQRYRPGYENRYGVDYEEFVKENILRDKLQNLFLKSVIVSDKELHHRYLLENTKFTFKRLTINPTLVAKDYSPSHEDLENQIELIKKDSPKEKSFTEEELTSQAKRDLIRQEGIKKATEVANTLWPLFTTDQIQKTDLEKYHVVSEELPAKAITQGDSLFPSSADDGLLTALFSLNKENPFPKEPLKVGDKYLFFKFVTMETPSSEGFEDWKNLNRKELSFQLVGQFYQRWYAEKARQEKIEIY